MRPITVTILRWQSYHKLHSMKLMKHTKINLKVLLLYRTIKNNSMAWLAAFSTTSCQKMFWLSKILKFITSSLEHQLTWLFLVRCISRLLAYLFTTIMSGLARRTSRSSTRTLLREMQRWAPLATKTCLQMQREATQFNSGWKPTVTHSPDKHEPNSQLSRNLIHPTMRINWKHLSN